VHTRPPTEAESVFIESRRIPDLEFLERDNVELALKAGFYVRRWMDRLPIPVLP
jgi:hypothetical protein